MKIFVCYSSKDEGMVTTLRNNLEKYYSLDVFCPNRELKGGYEYPTQMIRAIENCDVFVIILTKNFHGAEFTEQEVGIALAQNKLILPLKIDDTIPFGYIKTIQAVTPNGTFDVISNMVQISNAIYDLFYPNKLVKKSAIITNLETAYSWGNQNSLARMLDSDQEYTEVQIIKLRHMFTKGSFNGANYAKSKIESIINLNPINDTQSYDPDNDPALMGF